MKQGGGDKAYIENDKVVVKNWVKQTFATIEENIKVKRFSVYNFGEGLEKAWRRKTKILLPSWLPQSTAKPPSVLGKGQYVLVKLILLFSFKCEEMSY